MSDSHINTKPQVTMTGAEWYERFRQEWNEIVTEKTMGDLLIRSAIMQAAKRAAGITEETENE